MRLLWGEPGNETIVENEVIAERGWERGKVSKPLMCNTVYVHEQLDMCNHGNMAH